MPLLIQNRRIERPGSTVDLFARYPHLQENARVFRSMPVVDVDPKCLLYIQQREFAATTPADNSVAVLGSDDATTCHLVLVRHTGTAQAFLIDLAGVSWNDIDLIPKAKASFFKQKFASCSTNSKKFWDTVKSMENKSTSSQLPTALRLGNTVTTDKSTIIENFNKHFSTADHAFHLATPTPVNCPAPSTATRPSSHHFSFTQIQIADMADIYDSNKGVVKIGPCKWSPNLDISFWLSQDDDTILKYLSTSPTAEPPHFVQHIKSTIQFLLEHPSSDSVFPGGQPQHYRRTEQGDWENVNQT
ncbi:unnamed protein product [Oncorhynchus mykiss]|uniref:Uncharacterized protein n=1 Tax=Oncorhynchus mykiss TaxID=8022 RepID=A0A060X8G0_ONCMY|nr:unnamed protein product [Oncorhynchus mykiss]